MTSSQPGSNIVDLYTRIPDYSEVKHLGNSDFINTLENLKEQFRQCRASLHDQSDEVDDYLSSRTCKILNVSQSQSQSQSHTHSQTQRSSSKVSHNNSHHYYSGVQKKSTVKINNYQQEREREMANPNYFNYTHSQNNSANSNSNILYLTPTSNIINDKEKAERNDKDKDREKILRRESSSASAFSSSSHNQSRPHLLYPQKSKPNTNIIITNANNSSSNPSDYLSVSSVAIQRNPHNPYNLSLSCNLRQKQTQNQRLRSASVSARLEEEDKDKNSSPFFTVTGRPDQNQNPNPNPNPKRGLTVGLFKEYESAVSLGPAAERDWHNAAPCRSAYAEDFELCSSASDDGGVGDGVGGGGGDGSTPESGSGLSHWSSSPEMYTAKEKEFCPPTNIEKRILIRKAQNSSAPSIPAIDQNPPKSPGFRAHPVPSHVHKPLFDYIMLKNKRRSMRVREQSKQKLLAQVKPFSFSSDTRASKCSGGQQSQHSHHGHRNIHHQYSESSEPLLNNSRPAKSSSARRHQNGIKTNNNKFNNSHHQFKANPAPPRTRALLAAIKLREQQEYRELKKRLRAEALMKTASLPPSMAARDRRTKANLVRLDNLLSRFNNSSPLMTSLSHRRLRESSSDTFTDEDRLTDPEDFYLLGLHMNPSNKNPSLKARKGGLAPGTGTGTSRTKKLNHNDDDIPTCSRRNRRGNFTPYGEPRFPMSGNATGVFEATSNDNHASKLRIQVAKAKELERLQMEEEDLLRAMKVDKKRQKLRDFHSHAWRRAGSYSSSQDIAMRRQLRMAGAILERESYKKEMSSMLSRVRSAPLLLEGLRQRKSEPCKKHREMNSGKSASNKLSSPRRNYNTTTTNFSRSFFHNHRGDATEPEKSETAAFAEGSLTNSDNESVKNPELEFDDDEEEDEDDNEHINLNQNEKEDHQNEQDNNDNNNYDDEDNYENEQYENDSPSPPPPPPPLEQQQKQQEKEQHEDQRQMTMGNNGSSHNGKINSNVHGNGESTRSDFKSIPIMQTKASDINNYRNNHNILQTSQITVPIPISISTTADDNEPDTPTTTEIGDGQEESQGQDRLVVREVAEVRQLHHTHADFDDDIDIFEDF